MSFAAPGVENLIRDEQRDVTYRIMAYRKLSREEMVIGVQMYLRQARGKHPKKGTLVTIISVFQ